MALEQVAQAHYRRSSLTTRQTVAAVLALWRATGPSGFRDELVRAAGLVAAGQLSQAVQAADYLLALATEQGMSPPEAQLVPRALSGVAADGRPLADVLSYPIHRVWTMLDAGADFATAETSGTASLTRIVANEVTQAGTNGTQIGMTGQTQMVGYVRMLRAPSCGRCAILAGKWFRWCDGFARHPGCDCVHVPAAESNGVADLRTDPDAYFKSLSTADQDKYFGAANAQAIRDGSNMGQVVNASTVRRGGKAQSGLYEFDAGGGRKLQATTQGTTVRQGRAGRRMAVADGQLDGRIPTAFERANRPRLTPRSIYELAGDDRGKALQLLHDNGYLDSQPIDRSVSGLMADVGRPNAALGRR